MQVVDVERLVLAVMFASLTFASASILIVASSAGDQLPQSSIQVGAIFYSWYGWNETAQKWTGGLHTTHWNSDPATQFPDTPLSYYSSLDNHTLNWQIGQVRSAGITFLIASWWGWRDPTDQSVLNLFKYVHSEAPGLKLAILVEPFMQTMNYSETTAYVQQRFYSQFPQDVFQWENKPLIAWFLPSQPPPDPHFTFRTIGNGPTFQLGPFEIALGPDWRYINGMQALQSSGGSWQPDSPSNYEGMTISTDGEVTVIPRFDNYLEYAARGRQNYLRFDTNYTLNLYQQEWQYVLSNKSQVRLVLLIWNEFTESSEVEIHMTQGHLVNLLPITAQYVNLLSGT